MHNKEKRLEKIPSFTVDHLKLRRGVYVSRKDTTGLGSVITTFDVRMTEPNREPPMSGKALHAMEHLAATFLRSICAWSKQVIYWGPMGCRTGNYLILSGDLTAKDVVPWLQDLMAFIASYEGEIPGATAKECGNFSYMDLAEAKRHAARYLNEVLRDPSCPTEYPHNDKEEEK